MDTLLYQIALPLLPEVGLHWSRELVRYFGNAEDVFYAEHQDLVDARMSASAAEALIAGRQSALERAKREVDFIQRHQIKTYWFEDADYPAMLQQVPDAPTMLYVKGNVRFDGHLVAVVGTRAPSDYGKQMCEDFVAGLAARVPDVTIVSGLAYGVDISAHRAALKAGIPTLIVPAHGLDRIYPAIHRKEAVQALENGGIVTEYMSETQPEKQNFVARNRIVAGLCEATVVVASKAKGGSLITAGLALDYNRDVFAFPGRPSDLNSAGCNLLIRKHGAQLIDSADAFIEEMGWDVKKEPVQASLEEALFAGLTPSEERIMQVLGKHEDGLAVNELSEQAELPYSEVASLLFGMEMKGLIRALPGNRYRKK